MKANLKQGINRLAVILMCLILATNLLPSTVVWASTTDTALVIANAVNYLATQQNNDGGLRWTTSASDVGVTARGVAALAGVGYPVDFLVSGADRTMMDYLRLYGRSFAAPGGVINPGRTGILLLGVAAAGDDPTHFGADGWDIIGDINSTYLPTDGTYGPANIISQFWAVVSLSAAGYPIPQAATDWILAQQLPGGGWGWGLNDLDLTANMVVALLGSGNLPTNHQSIQSALALFDAHQLPSGGWKNAFDQPTDPDNPDTTGWVIQALLAAGYTPVGETWASLTGDPISALEALQDADGALVGNPSAKNAYATVEGLFGLAEQPLYGLGSRVRASRALTYLHHDQLANGSWGGVGATADAALAFLSAGYDPSLVSPIAGGPSAMDYLKANAAAYTALGPDAAGKLLLVAAEAGENVYSFNGLDLVAAVNSYYAANAFGDASNTWHQAFAIISLAAAGEAIPAGVVDTLKGLQNLDGGWGYASYWNVSSPDNTGMALMALIAAGVQAADTSITDALAFLTATQDTRGGWGDSNNTALAIQGLLAVGEDLSAPGWLKNNHGPWQALVNYQKTDGPFVYNWAFSGADDPYSTRQAVPALLSKPFPLPDNPQHQAGLVVDFNDGTMDTYCVKFYEPSITGLDLIIRSGIAYEQEAGFITRLGSVGCPASNSGCQDPFYWFYFQWDANTLAWQSSLTGVTGSTVSDGEVEGFIWSDYNIFPTPPPGLDPILSQICPAAFTDLPLLMSSDRAVVRRILTHWNGTGTEITLPVGSDLDGNASVVVNWSTDGRTWVPVTMSRVGSTFSGVSPTLLGDAVMVKASISDAGYVEFAGDILPTQTFYDGLTIYLALIGKE